MATPGDLTDFFTVSLPEAEIRLDKLLSVHFPDHSRTYFQYLIEQGCVLVNGSVLKKREHAKVGDEVEVCFQLTPEISLEPQNIPLDILYEDEHLIAVNKPANMVVHPAPGHPKDTFVNALLYHCQSLQGTDPLRPGIVHRLDKDTSGIILAAKTAMAHAKLVELFSERRIQKYYLAVCVGTPKEGLIDAPIKRHPVQRKEMAVNFADGKEAKSVCRVLGKNEQLSLVEVQLLTGRTHQIRVHLKHIGCPILGDGVYGSANANKKFHPQRQLLHAQRLEFRHPITGVALNLSAPIPKDLMFYVELLR
ncbi:MAG: RluA family pseudouridine synthase [Verrucomicrobia bacterium]|nr:RluA family pseudouridine synthase [Verrucomicrobiota bacterium]